MSLRGTTTGRLPAAVLVTAGMVIALNIGKLPPALPELQREFGLSLVEVSWMVSLFMVGPALFGFVAGTVADRFEARSVMLAGMLLMAASGALGALAPSVSVLFVSRALESAGFLLAVLPAPALVARSVPHASLRGWLGIWSAYMPAGMGIGLLVTPALMQAVGWRGTWAVCAAAASMAVLAVALTQPPRAATATATEVASLRSVAIATLRTPGPWLLALCFLFYAGQFIGIFSFLPTIYQEAGLSAQLGATLTAVAVMINMAGNLSSGLLMQRGVGRSTLIAVAGLTMAFCEWFAFGSSASFGWRYASILLLSAVAGLIPGALFATAPFYAPSVAAVSGTIGLMQQGSSLGQLLLPLAIAALAQYTGGWTSTWIATGAAALVTVALAWAIARYDRVRRRRRSQS